MDLPQDTHLVASGSAHSHVLFPEKEERKIPVAHRPPETTEQLGVSGVCPAGMMEVVQPR